MPDRRSSRTRRCDVFGEPKNKEEALIKAESDAEYARFHESPAQDDALIAEARPNPVCPICGESDQAIRWGKAESGLPRYRCKRCQRTFTPASGGLIDQRKLPLKTMVKFLADVLTGTSVSEASKVLDAFKSHISPGSTLIHDLDFSHYGLIARLRLADQGEKAIYKFNCRSGLDPINRYCSNMEDFVRLHRGMNKHRFQDWMNLFAFKFGCPGNALQKAEKLLDLLPKCKETIRYRD